MDILAKRIKQLRDEKKKENSKYTQEYVANLIGIARVTYTAYENGTKIPPADAINKIAEIFSTTTDYILGRTDNPKQSIPYSHEDFNQLSEINKLLNEYQIDDIGFFDIEKWKNMSRKDIEHLRRTFELLTNKNNKTNKGG
ncbi:helix-turn-helix domain-containing protein [Calidifontibacillus oryziterrae]|uniref:helix-turn-helix domain-containing protein n=1 Tax=Calidifontibacillus oryziterrae TaxID=1191699 RepID=UPI00031B4615|nr:helix-turn-helix transcriptional regulator [Calidifontibacillus oryziterrae]